jgi:ubiquitin C-terminal hydrolase
MQCFLHLEPLRAYVLSDDFLEAMNSRFAGGVPGAAAQEYRLLQTQIDENTKISGPVLLQAIRTLMPLSAIRRATARRKEVADKKQKAEARSWEAQQVKEAADGQAEGQTAAPTRRARRATAAAKARASFYTPATDPGTGEDLSEALLSFLDRLHDELTIPNRVSDADSEHLDPADRYWETLCARGTSIIQHFFSAVTNCVTTCSQCGHATNVYQEIRLIDLRFPAEEGPFSLEGLIQGFSMSSEKEGQCDNCGRLKVVFEDRVYFAKLPPRLLFLVARFGNTRGTTRPRKGRISFNFQILSI